MYQIKKLKSQFLLSLTITLSLSATTSFASSIYSDNITPCDSFAIKATSQKNTMDQAFEKSGQVKCQTRGRMGPGGRRGGAGNRLRWNASQAEHKNWCQNRRQNNRLNAIKNKLQLRGTKVLECLNAIAPAAPAINLNDNLLSNTPNQLGQKLTNASGANQLKRAKKILAAGAPKKWQGNWGNDGQALKFAIENMAMQTTQFLLKIGGFHPDHTSNGGAVPLATVTASNHQKKYKMMRLLLNNGASPDHLGELLNQDKRAINIAIENEDLKAIKILLKFGSNPNSNSGSDTVLMRAIDQGNAHIVFLILSGSRNPADPNMNAFNQTCGNYRSGAQSPLDRAIALGNQFVIDQLLYFGAKKGRQC